MKKLIYRPLILSFTLILTLIFVLQVSYGYFDNLQGSRSSTILIGDWLNNVPNAEDVEQYVKEIIFPEDENLADYVLETIGEYVDGEYVVDEVFSDYSMQELVEIVDLINEFTDTFLDYNDGDVTFPNIKVDPIPIDLNESFNPGSVKYIKKVIQTAEYANTTDWAPITFQLVLSAPEGVDISDFSVEVIFDATPLAIVNPFAYDYILKDPYRNYYSMFGQQTVSSNVNSNLPLMGEVSYINRAYSVNQNKFLRFKHEYFAPSQTGEWKRFPIGPNLYFNKPATGGLWAGMRQQFELESVPNKQVGMTLSGRNDGGVVEILFNMNARRPRTEGSLPVIPVTIIISRAMEVNENGEVLSTQRTNPIIPDVKFRVVKGNVWNNS